MINGISWLVVTKLDVLDELAEIPVCVAYKVDGKPTDEIPAQDSGCEKIECMYRTMPGWQSSTQGITAMDELPRRPASISRSSKRKAVRASVWYRPDLAGNKQW